MATHKSKNKDPVGQISITIKEICHLYGAVSSIHPTEGNSLMISTKFGLYKVAKKTGIEVIETITSRIYCFAQSLGITAVSIPNAVLFLKGKALIKYMRTEKQVIYIEPLKNGAFSLTFINNSIALISPSAVSGETCTPCLPEVKLSPTIASLDTVLLNTLYTGQCSMIQIIQMDNLNYRITLTSEKSRFAICWDEQKLLIYDKAKNRWQSAYLPGITCATITKPDEFHVGTSGSEIHRVTLRQAKQKPKHGKPHQKVAKAGVKPPPDRPHEPIRW